MFQMMTDNNDHDIVTNPPRAFRSETHKKLIVLADSKGDFPLTKNDSCDFAWKMDWCFQKMEISFLVLG